jgi:hypothetical protein
LLRLQLISDAVNDQFPAPLTEPPQATLEDYNQFKKTWNDQDFNLTVKPKAPWRNLLFRLTDEIITELAGFQDHRQRIASIEGWLTSGVENETDALLIIDVLITHANIFWRISAQRGQAVKYLEHAEKVLKQRRAMDLANEQKCLLLMGNCLARMGEYDQVLSISQRLDSELRLRLAAAVLLSEKNRRLGYELESRFLYYLEPDRLNSAIKALTATTSR